MGLVEYVYGLSSGQLGVQLDWVHAESVTVICLVYNRRGRMGLPNNFSCNREVVRGLG